MQQSLMMLQIAVSILLMITILLQQKSGLSKSEGRFYKTLRGLEKKIFWATVFLGFCFILLALLNLLL